MITTNELRIGNLVSIPRFESDEPVKITAKGILQIEDGNLSVVGIPLTTDWLDKSPQLGRTTKDGEFSYFNGDDIMIRVKDMSLFLHSEYDGSTWFVKRLKYVHQLQNLYYSLTGKELEINL